MSMQVTSKKYHNEDITFCMNHGCNIMHCIRNPKNIKQTWKYHSYAFLENTKDCCKRKKGTAV